MRALLCLFSVVALACGCDSLPPAPGSESTSAPLAAASPPSPRALSPQVKAAAPVPAAPALPATVLEVEVSGQIVLPAGAPAGRLLVALTDGPCFQAGTHYLAWTQPGPSGNYLLGAFPSVGTRLESCGAVIEPLRRGVVWWGRADRGTMEVQGRGKTIYRDTNVSLRRGPEVPLPVGLKLAP